MLGASGGSRGGSVGEGVVEGGGEGASGGCRGGSSRGSRGGVIMEGMHTFLSFPHSHQYLITFWEQVGEECYDKAGV